jgi:hypothetical protein
MKRPTRKHRKAANWAQLLEAWAQSGKSAQDFAALHGLSPRTLLWWQWRLGKGKKRRKAKATPNKPRTAPRLVAVKLDEPDDAASSDVAWELDMAGALLRVHRAIAASELERVLAAMSAKAATP